MLYYIRKFDIVEGLKGNLNYYNTLYYSNGHINYMVLPEQYCLCCIPFVKQR